MAFLKFLESLRTPVGEGIASAVTLLGEETFFTVLGLIIVWCWSKKWGFRFLLTGLTGTAVNQLLKAIFVVPRPWILDPEFTIVESARAGATGYSFPSGHTQSAATVFGVLALWARKGWTTARCVAAVLLVGFSRMYLGVHTPLDVGVSLATGLVTVLGLHALFIRAEGSLRRKAWISAGMCLFVLALVLFVTLTPARPNSDPEFDAHGVDAAWKLAGSTLGLTAAWLADERWLHFDTRAVWWAQACKLILGLGLVLGIRIGLKPLLALLLGDGLWVGGLRYLLMTLAGGVLWPMTFRFWGRLGRGRQLNPVCGHRRESCQ